MLIPESWKRIRSLDDDSLQKELNQAIESLVKAEQETHSLIEYIGALQAEVRRRARDKIRRVKP